MPTGAVRVAALYPARPRAIDRGGSTFGFMYHGGERVRATGEHLDLTAAVVEELGCGVGDANEARVRKCDGRTVPELVVEFAAEQQHDVASAMARPRIAPACDGWSDGTSPRLSCVSR